MVKMDGTYQGGLRCEIQHQLSGAKLITDAPLDNNGQGRSFSPTDLVGASLGACMMTIMGIWAERNGVNLVGTTFAVTKEMSATPPRKIANLTLRFEMAAGVDPAHRERLEAAARACPVHHALHPDVKCEIAFNWR